MKHNKVLSLAIASALALSASPSYAAKLTVEFVDDTCTVHSGPGIFASEYFCLPGRKVLDGYPCPGSSPDDLDNGGENGPAADGSYDDRYFYATYEFTEKTLGSLAFLARFQLSNGASFSDDVSLAGGTSLDFVAHPSGTHSAVTTSGALGNGGSEGDTQVTFYVTPPQGGGGDFAKGNKLFFRFNLQDLDILSDPGEKIDLTAEVFSGPNEADSFDGGPVTETVATSAKGYKVDINAANGVAEIDVVSGSVNFVGSPNVVLSPIKVKLGSLAITDNTSVYPPPMKGDGSPWQFGTDAENCSGMLWLENATLSNQAYVFLDFNNNGDFDINSDMNGSINYGTSVVTWSLSNQQLTDIYNTTQGVDFIIEVDGVTPIEEHNDPARATLQISCGGCQDTFPGDLLHIKRNGTVCSLYYIPAPNSGFTTNIRIINTSDKAGTILGSLRDKEGDYLFENEQLIPSLLIPSLPPYTSRRLTAQYLQSFVAKPWQGTAILTIQSDIKSLEIFGLVREKAGGPLTDISVGATGNGCD